MPKPKTDPKPCPNCGHCPTCGHTPYRVAPQIVPYWVPYYPYKWLPRYPTPIWSGTTTTSLPANTTITYEAN